MAEENYTNQGSAVSPQGEMGEQSRRQQTGSGSSGPGGNVHSSGTSKRTKRTERLTAVGTSGQVWDEATEGIRTLKENTDEYVRRNPAKAVFTALAIGFVLALMRRR
jgi:ElaB/YqjD/DUF883 family membrane-anchored ribosome-binding protein